MVTILLQKILDMLSSNISDIEDLLDSINEKLTPDENKQEA